MGQIGHEVVCPVATQCYAHTVATLLFALKMPHKLSKDDFCSARQRLKYELKESRAREMGTVGSPKAAAHHPAKQNNKCTSGLSGRRRPPVTLALASHFARRPADRVPRPASSAHQDPLMI
jgi:hypothetical protein